MKNLKELEEELSNNFQNQNIYVELIGDISYITKINNLKYLLNKINLILTDSEQNQISICFDEVGDIEIKERFIQIEFNYNQTIKIYV